MSERHEAQRELPQATGTTKSSRWWQNALLMASCVLVGCLLLVVAPALFGLVVLPWLFAAEAIFMSVAALIARHNGRNPWLWVLAELLVGPLAIVLLLVLRRAPLRPQAISRRRALGLVAVVLVAVLVGVITHHVLFRPLTGDLAQISVSPDKHWELRTYRESDLGFGPDSGAMRAEIRQLVPGASRPRTIYLVWSPSEENLGIVWRKDDVLVVRDEFGDQTILDPRTAPPVRVPLGFLQRISGWFWTIVLGILVLVGGCLGVVMWRLPRGGPSAAEGHRAPVPQR